MTTEKRRARRIAADEAHAWARNLRLRNHHAKSVLRSLTLYIDGDGFCYVAIPTLAEDCELSDDTVRRRLAWLEDIGAVTRRPQWIDERGLRNADGRGKRTTDQYRLMFDADPEEIEARAAGVLESVSREVSPSSQRGLNPPDETVSPAPALGQPSHCGEGLISEPEPESPPKSPSGGREGDREALEESEPEDFEPALQAWPPGARRRDLALVEFRQLDPDKQRLCRAAIGPFLESQRRLKRDTVPNFHLWIRQRRFEEFPNARLPDPPPARRWIDGDELAGLQLALRMASRPPVRLVEDPERGRGLWSVKPLQADLAAMGRFAGADPSSWHQVELGTPQFAAWRDRLALWLGGEIEAERVWTEDHDPAVHDLHALHPNFRLRKSKNVLRVPADWPPHRDGTWSIEGDQCA